MLFYGGEHMQLKTFRGLTPDAQERILAGADPVTAAALRARLRGCSWVVVGLSLYGGSGPEGPRKAAYRFLLPF